MNTNVNSAAFLPQIRKKGRSSFNKLPLNGTATDIVIVFDQSDDKTAECVDEMIRSIFLNSEACRVCGMTAESVDQTLAELENTRNLGFNRPCRILLLIRESELNRNDRLLCDISAVAAAHSSGFITCILKEKQNAGGLSLSEHELPDRADRAWVTYADSVHVAFTLLLLLYDKADNAERVVAIDHCVIHNVGEYSKARYAAGFLRAILEKKTDSFDAEAYWKKTADDYRESFLNSFPAKTTCLPHYNTASGILPHSCTIMEYYGKPETGVAVPELYFNLLLEKCAAYLDTVFDSATVMGGIPIGCFTDNAGFKNLEDAAKKLRSDEGSSRKGFMQQKATKKTLKEFDTSWCAELRASVNNKICDLILKRLKCAKNQAMDTQNTVNDLLNILDRNYEGDSPPITNIPDNKNWYNFTIDDLLEGETRIAFSQNEYHRIMNVAFGVPTDASSQCLNLAFMNNKEMISLAGGELVHLTGMPEGLIISGRVRWLGPTNKSLEE